MKGTKINMGRLAESLILKSNEYMSLELGCWFESAEHMSRMVVGQANSGVFDEGDTDTYLSYFYHLLRQYQFMKYGAIVTQGDHEYSFYFDDDGIFTSREGWLSKWGGRAIYRTWEQEPAGNTWQLLSELEDSEYFDGSTQEWILAARSNEPGYISWTPPFKTRVGKQLLVALSSKWKKTGKEDDNILGLGILLTEISQYTRMQEVSPGGSVFILSGDGRYIGLPRQLSLGGENDLESKLLAHVDSVDISAPGKAWEIWNENGRVERAPFELFTEQGKFWGSFDLFPLADGKKLIIGVTIPEKDILSELKRT